MDIENLDTEWKESWSDKYLKTIAAFYNTKGGRMIVGRKDNGEYVGVRDVKGTTKAVSDSIRNKLHIISETRAENIEGKDCILIDVPKGDAIVDCDGRFYFRVGNTTQQLEGNPLKKILLDEMGLQWLDQPCKVDPDDLSEDAFRFFMKKGKEAKRIPDDVPEDDMMLAFRTMGLMHGDEPTLTAALLFTRNPERFEYGSYLKIGLFDGKDCLMRDDILDRIPLVMLPDECMRVLGDKYIQPTYRYDTGTASRELDYLYPMDAVRELVVNAIVHKDYSMQQEIAVYVYDDRLMVYSSGLLPEGITLENLKGSHPSVKRNRRLAEAFYAMRYIEGWGQGINRVLSACKENGNPEPEFSYMSNGLLVTLRPKTRRDIAAGDVEAVLDPGDCAIISILKANPSASVAEISSETGLSNRIVRYRIDKLRKKDIVTREGSKKTGKWIIDDNHYSDRSRVAYSPFYLPM